MIIFFQKRCVDCGACAKSCPLKCIQKKQGVYVIDSSICDACGKCYEVCPVALQNEYSDFIKNHKSNNLQKV